MIEAKIIADSIGPFGDRIITYVLTFPRIVLAEFNTHRALSRNSASSRAIPFKKMVKMVQENPFVPIRWMKEHTGMQGYEYFTDEEEILSLVDDWLLARTDAVNTATELNKKGVTKQICNRLLEPFMWHTCIATGTEWENFFALRAHPDAEIHIQELAYKMLEAANASTPKVLGIGEWHIPFGDDLDARIREVEELIMRDFSSKKDYIELHPAEWLRQITGKKLQIATARCARVSYLNFEGKDDFSADIELYNRLLKSGHMSPFEHCAIVIPEDAYYGALCDVKFKGGDDRGNAIYEYGWSGNFRGFKQLRWAQPNENKKDERYNRK